MPNDVRVIYAAARALVKSRTNIGATDLLARQPPGTTSRGVARCESSVDDHNSDDNRKRPFDR